MWSKYENEFIRPTIKGVEDEEVELCREVRRRRVGVGGGVGVMGRGGGLAQCLRTGKDELGTGNFYVSWWRGSRMRELLYLP